MLLERDAPADTAVVTDSAAGASSGMVGRAAMGAALGVGFADADALTRDVRQRMHQVRMARLTQ